MRRREEKPTDQETKEGKRGMRGEGEGRPGHLQADGGNLLEMVWESGGLK